MAGPNKQINVKAFIADLRAGMDDSALMQKYELSEKGLESVFRKLLDAGVLKQEELDRRKIVVTSDAADTREEPNKDVPSPEDVSVTNSRLGESPSNYRSYAIIFGIGLLVIVAGYFAFEEYRLPHQVDAPQRIEDALVQHYSSDQTAPRA
jgi:hypothetical protein